MVVWDGWEREFLASCSMSIWNALQSEKIKNIKNV